MKLRFYLAAMALLAGFSASATRVVETRVVDKDYVMVHLRDGEVRYRDNGTGPSAFLGHTFVEGDDTLVTFLPRLDGVASVRCEGWRIVSADDAFYASGRAPVAVFRKSKPMNTDHRLISELDHWLFLKLPRSMQQGTSYKIFLPREAGAGAEPVQVCFDIWNAPSEAVHVNINGYALQEAVKKADLYLWLGDGGPRDYASFEGKKVFLYHPESGRKAEVGKVSFWKPQDASAFEAGKKDLTGSPVWDVSFRCNAPGTYRLVVEDVGCSMDFVLSADAYFQPYR